MTQLAGSNAVLEAGVQQCCFSGPPTATFQAPPSTAGWCPLATHGGRNRGAGVGRPGAGRGRRSRWVVVLAEGRLPTRGQSGRSLIRRVQPSATGASARPSARVASGWPAKGVIARRYHSGPCDHRLMCLGHPGGDDSEQGECPEDPTHLCGLPSRCVGSIRRGTPGAVGRSEDDRVGVLGGETYVEGEDSAAMASKATQSSRSPSGTQRSRLPRTRIRTARDGGLRVHPLRGRRHGLHDRLRTRGRGTAGNHQRAGPLRGRLRAGTGPCRRPRRRRPSEPGDESTTETEGTTEGGATKDGDTTSSSAPSTSETDS